ncbi:MAG: diaminopimelate epimerase [Crocinitomicaceae bacterium]
MIEFEKYHGAGNDFILIDNRQGQFVGDKVSFSKKWCSRRFGIGSDGIIFLEQDPEFDFVMDFYNPDGSQSFCGNGSRCVVAFAKKLGIINNEAVFKAIDGIHHAQIREKNIAVLMNDVHQVIQIEKDYFIHTGSPHYISYCNPSDERDIVAFGKEIRYSEPYKKEGTNVNLVRELNNGKIDLRTYERGVEDETFACGTGATAAALSYAVKNDWAEGTIDVQVKGGDLQLSFHKEGDVFKDIWLIGPAEFVFKGQING